MPNLSKILAWINDMKGPTGARGFEKAISLGTQILGLSSARTKHCFGMSKMTVLDENTNAALKFNNIAQVEFYEFIARMAAEMYKDVQSWSLAEKINKVMDTIFKKFKLTRIKVGEKVDDDEASSEDSVDFETVDIQKQIIASTELYD